MTQTEAETHADEITAAVLQTVMENLPPPGYNLTQTSLPNAYGWSSGHDDRAARFNGYATKRLACMGAWGHYMHTKVPGSHT